MNIKPLKKFSINEIKPEGWLLNQLKLQADGLIGNLDKIWKEIKNSRWLGGNDKNDDKLPLWLSGIIPTAYFTDNKELQNRIKEYMDTITENIPDDGWLNPEKDKNSADLISSFYMMKCYIMYQDAASYESSEKIIYRALKCIDSLTDTHPLKGKGQILWIEACEPILWLYGKCGEDWLLFLLKKLECQGFDWIKFFSSDSVFNDAESIPQSQFSSAFNIAVNLKSGAELYDIYDDKILDSVYDIQYIMDTYHGTVTGMFTGDTYLAGQNPSRGFELCSIVEYLKSLSKIISSTMDIRFADRFEKTSFNAFPSACAPDMWTFQNTQQINQVQCTAKSENVFSSNGKKSSIFGFDTESGLSTVYASQAYPELLMNSFMKSEDGIYIISYIPSKLQTVINGCGVTVEITGAYPFRESFDVIVSCSSQCSFTLGLRIPEWVDEAKISTGNEPIHPIKKQFYRFSGTWTDKTVIHVELHSEFRLVKRPNNLYAVVKGPLVFSMPVNEEKRFLDGNDYPYSEYELIPADSWNYAICIDDKDRFAHSLTFEEKNITNTPFSPVTPPLEMYTYGRKIQWPLRKNSAAPNPFSVAVSDKKEMLRFIPYGCTNLRITELPLIK